MIYKHDESGEIAGNTIMKVVEIFGCGTAESLEKRAERVIRFSIQAKEPDYVGSDYIKRSENKEEGIRHDSAYARGPNAPIFLGNDGSRILG